MTDLANSKRQLYTASYVATKLSPEDQRRVRKAPGNAFRKANLLRALRIDDSQVQVLRQQLEHQNDASTREAWQRLINISTMLARVDRRVSNFQIAEQLSSIPDETLLKFAEAARPPDHSNFGAHIVVDSYKKQLHLAPIGRLHLERLEMVPAGVERGELVFTVPMAPKETVTISHKEWSTTSSEFEDILQDSFESYSERGVAEKTDASMSTENEARHSNELTFGATLSGSYSGVSLTTTFGLKSTNEERDSVKNSFQRNKEITEKSSARAKKEHKISVKLETKKGVEDSSYRTISNPSKTDAIRIDYYRMMRKWRTDLFRYGLRLTYDITIPTPGARLFARYQKIAELDQQLRTPLSFTLKPEDIRSSNYRQEAIKLSTTVDDPPAASIPDRVFGRIEFLDEDAAGVTRIGQIDIQVPAGYFIAAITFPAPKLEAHLATWPDHGGEFAFDVAGSIQQPMGGDHVVKAELSSLSGKTGRQAMIYKYRYVSVASLEITLTYQLEKAALEKWQFTVWNQLHAAAQARYQEHLLLVQQERDRLWLELSGRDTLSLRRLEREELLRVIMQWLIGPDYFETAPNEVSGTIDKIQSNERVLMNGTTGPFQPISEMEWGDALAFGEFVKFIQEAIEWENIIYFQYPYFWGSESLGRQKLLFEHPDPQHRNFLRAGYVRVVVTVRPGFEEDFTHLIETGSMSSVNTSPYMPIAQEVANFAHVNYTNLAPANPEKHARPLLYPQQRKTWDTMQSVIKLIDSFNTDNGRYPTDLSELAGGPFKDAWGNPLEYRMPGAGNEYDLVSLGKDGAEGGEGLDADISSSAAASLVATWFEYTPTSGIDIEIDTKPGIIA